MMPQRVGYDAHTIHLVTVPAGYNFRSKAQLERHERALNRL